MNPILTAKLNVLTSPKALALIAGSIALVSLVHGLHVGPLNYAVVGYGGSR